MNEEFTSKLSQEIEGDGGTLSEPETAENPSLVGNSEDTELSAPETISEPVALALASALTKIETYVPTQYVDYTEPDIDADNLNHAEQAIMRVTNLMNGAVDVINSLVTQVNQNEADIDSLNSQLLVQTGNITQIENDFVLSGIGSTHLKKIGDSVFLDIDLNIKIDSGMSDYVTIFTIPPEFSPHSYKIISTVPQNSSGTYPVMIMVNGTIVKMFSAGPHPTGRLCGIFAYTTK